VDLQIVGTESKCRGGGCQLRGVGSVRGSLSNWK
jgi:hypothetical protein